MAPCAQGNQIQIVIRALLAAQVLVVDLQVLSGATDLASPVIASQHLFSQLVGRTAGPGFSGSAVNRGLALIDFDNDGFMDLIFTRLDASPALLHNVSADGKSTQHHWLAMKLEGTRSNRDSFGARVKVTQDGATQTREVRSNFSYLSASDPRPHFGFGSNAHPVDIQVHWPSGTVDTLQNIAVDRFILLKEGSSPISRQSDSAPTRPLRPAP